MGTRRLSWRRLWSLIRYLPSESATAAAMHGEQAAWTLTDHLLATVVDVLQWANWQRGDPKRSPKPEPIPRPGGRRLTTGGRSSLTPNQMLARLKAQQHRNTRRAVS